LLFGIKDGILFLGTLKGNPPAESGEPPDIEWGAAAGGKPVFRAVANMEVMDSLLASYCSPRIFPGLESAIMEMGIDDMLDRQVFSGVIQALIAMQEVKKLTLDVNDWSAADVSIFTGNVDYRKVLELNRLYRRLNRD
jgi:hypothetical protein